MPIRYQPQLVELGRAEGREAADRAVTSGDRPTPSPARTQSLAYVAGFYAGLLERAAEIGRRRTGTAMDPALAVSPWPPGGPATAGAPAEPVAEPVAIRPIHLVETVNPYSTGAFWRG